MDLKLLKNDRRRFFGVSLVKVKIWMKRKVLHYFFGWFVLGFDFHSGEKNNIIGLFKNTFYF